MQNQGEILLRKGASFLSAVFVVVIISHYATASEKDWVPSHLVFKASGPATLEHFKSEFHLWKLANGIGMPESCIQGFPVKN